MNDMGRDFTKYRRRNSDNGRREKVSVLQLTKFKIGLQLQSELNMNNSLVKDHKREYRHYHKHSQSQAYKKNPAFSHQH